MSLMRARKKALVVGFAMATSMAPGIVSAQQCGESNCCRPGTASAAAAPGQENAAAAAQAYAAPTMFAAPAPTGEISGARSSLGLPALRLSLPRITLETPELTLHGFSRMRRDPQMSIDGATAPASQQSPLLFGQLTGVTAQGTVAPARTANPGPAAAAPAADEPSDNCVEEGCLTGASQNRNRTGPPAQVASHSRQTASGATRENFWKTPAERQTEEYREQVAELESQISELQSLVRVLIETKKNETTPIQHETPANTRKSQVINPWKSEDSRAPVPPVRHPDAALAQAERIAALEAELAALRRQSEPPQVSHRIEDAVPLISRNPRLSDDAPVSEPREHKPHVLKKLAVSLSRR